MALPDGFSSWEHLQDVLRKYHNKLVREEFSDITDDDAIAIPRGALKRACLLDDDDTVDMTLLRLHLFFFHARKAADLQAPIYGIPVDSYDERVVYKPQVNLFFRQDEDATPQRRNPTYAEISYRLINETPSTITEADLVRIGNRIKAEFGASNGYRWSKGKILVTYKNLADGLNLQIYALNESEGIGVIRKVCDCAQQSYNDNYVVVHEPKAPYSNNPGNQIILGKSRKIPVRRPTATVRFLKANISIHGLPHPISLVGRLYTQPTPMISF
jgi:hypothetical protein